MAPGRLDAMAFIGKKLLRNRREQVMVKIL